MAQTNGYRGSVGSILLLGFAYACGGQTDSGASNGLAGAPGVANAGNATGNGSKAGASPAPGAGAAATSPSASYGSNPGTILTGAGGGLVLPLPNTGGSVTALASSQGGMVAGPDTHLGGGAATASTIPLATGGSGGTTGGSGGTSPATNNLFVKQNSPLEIDKVDILFMIDNSLAMGDKQLILQASVPQLLRRLTSPNCVDPNGVLAPVAMTDPLAPCAAPLQREAPAAKDIHVGIITSSLGDFGGDTCPTPEEDPKGAANSPQNVAMNDHAWLLGTLPRNAGALDAPFLAWGPVDAAVYATSIERRISDFRSHVAAATEIGCGNEMSLEAWYRFLIDPKPPIDVSPPVNADGKQSSGADVRGPIDQNILAQRSQFLRPDSLVAIVMLTDENDCSMRDDSYSWTAMTFGQGFRMWRGSSVCKDDPNNECCYSCMLDSSAPAKCQAIDTACRIGDSQAKLPASADDLNVRCRQTKKRFGYDFLFPPSRYVNAIMKSKLCPDQNYGDLDCDCTEAKKKNVPCNPGVAVDNPLYVNLNPKVVPTGPLRIGPDAVFLVGLVGVPWQDLAVNATSPILEYKRATKLSWDLFAPRVNEDYSSAMLGDPLMYEAFDPRPGLPGPDAARWANPSNGHEWNTSGKDVQFACIFSLETELKEGQPAAHVCDLEQECGNDDGSAEYKKCLRRLDGCSCTPTAAAASVQSALDPAVTHSPLCQDSKNGYGSTQYFAKAQPGLRELQVLRGYYESSLNDNAIVGSICPKDLSIGNQANPSYGYNPTMHALTNALQAKLGKVCLPRSFTVLSDGTIPCSLVEAIPPAADSKWCNCADNQRSQVSSDVATAVRTTMVRNGVCGLAGLPACTDYCLCQLHQFTSGTPDGERCLNELNVERNSPSPGFCYVDPAQHQGSAAVTTGCGSIIRIVGNVNSVNQQLAAPAPGTTYLACSAQ